MSTHPVAIIGAGPIGLEVAASLKRAGIDALHLEAGEIGSTMAWWAPGTRYFSSPERIAIAGVPLVVENQEKATREDYLRYLRQVVMQFDLRVRTFERVVGAERTDEGFLLRTAPSTHGVGGPAEQARATPPAEGDSTYRAQCVVLAVGNMHRPRMVEVPGEDLPHVSHYLEDPHKYFGKRVVIVGGRNSAVEAAIRLYRAGAAVTLCQRRAEPERDRIKYWLLPELEWLIEKGLIGFASSAEVCSIGPDSIEIVREGRAERLRADFVLLLTGYVQDPSLFEMLGVECFGPERRPRFDNHTMETNVPGVYVAGTAVGGSQARARVFIENSHEHVERIVRHIAGRDVEVRSKVVFEGYEEG